MAQRKLHSARGVIDHRLAAAISHAIRLGLVDMIGLWALCSSVVVGAGLFMSRSYPNQLSS
ncbi:hypothetical protein [Effusibacillus dendaii]|uniref:Uncharacterized protein n=1 Tax=Effusibacillus dendaii TaxID=2743772 RepID=A0A7I8DAN3_9BACL|nr:hypothetical protein [Effusibacillus dendaii]BCJ87248.1 hypothetical protein skT53_22330 [Effusibacillus dendaii]